VINAATFVLACDQQSDSDMQYETAELQGRLRAVNIEHRRLLKQRTSEGWFARVGLLRSERRVLIAQIAGSLDAAQIAAPGGPVPHEVANQNAPA
jgi:hypothetical protein